MSVGFPQDPAAWLALVLAALLFVFGKPLLRPAPSDRNFLLLASLSSALLSAAYVEVYLRGGPRIIDATSYYLEARSLSEGYLHFRVDEPIASTLGRFLLRSEGNDGTYLSVLFPPGYPAVLALGFLLRAPMAVGPCLAAAITLATYALAKRVASALPNLVPGISMPRLATLLSVLCAALRYHTADTMSHGLSALCVTTALALALMAKQSGVSGKKPALLRLAVGFCWGLLFATRPASALALAIALLLAPSLRPSSIVWLLLGALPGIGLFFAHQYAATGELFASSQRAYYAVSDGPPDCFRFGFGKGVGCLGEHGDFVEHNLPNGYGAYAATATTLRRLKQHLVDAGNSDPFFLLVLFGGYLAARSSAARVLTIAVLAQMLAYVPFYFDGNYPGGGARFYADVLPLEHILLALAILVLAKRAEEHRPSTALRIASLLLALVPLGFAFRTGFAHAALRDREGGLPMFEPERVRQLPKNALVFVDTDHGFNLGFDPAPKGNEGIQVRRFHGDALDFLAFTSLGKPPTFRYQFGFPNEGKGLATVEVLPYAPTIEPSGIVVEGESLWPPLAQTHGYALVRYASGTCASQGRWLSVVSAEPSGASAKISVTLPAALYQGRALGPRIGVVGPVRGSVALFVDGSPTPLVEWPLNTSDESRANAPVCQDLAPQPVPEGARTLRLMLMREPGQPASTLALDSIRATKESAAGAENR